MDNKKWYKKIATIFWWVMTFLPLLVVLIYFIGYHFTFNSGINTAQELASYHENGAGYFYLILDQTLVAFEDLEIGYLETMFQSLFDTLNVNDNILMGALFGYMLSIQVYHLLFDCLVFFIHLLHSFLETERWKI